MNYQEACEVLDEAWGAFFGVLWRRDFNIDKLNDGLDRKDLYNAVQDVVMESKPKGGEEE